MQPQPFEYAIIMEEDIHTFQSHVNDLAGLGYVLGQVLHNTYLVRNANKEVLYHSFVAVMGQKEVKYEAVER